MTRKTTTRVAHSEAQLVDLGERYDQHARRDLDVCGARQSK